MPIPFVCPHCGQKTDVDERYAGQSGPCAGCGRTVTIPWPAAVASHAPPGRGLSPVAIVVLLLLVLLVCGGILVVPFFWVMRDFPVPADPPGFPPAPNVVASSAECSNNLQRIGLALHNYASQYAALPPGAILAAYPKTGTADFDPWTEAAGAAGGMHGTSWMLQVLPFIEQNAVYGRWDFTKSVLGNQAVAATDIGAFYCPTRRGGVRPEDQFLMFPKWAGRGSSDGWTRGGNDYAGCIGAQNAYANPTTSGLARKFCGPTYVYDAPPTGTTPSGRRICLRGIFVPNRSTRFNEIADGLSNTILLAEVPRKQWTGPAPDQYWGPCHTHIDGWAAAGPNTLFDTAKAGEGTDKGQTGGFNRDYFESAGSDHSGGAHFALADGSAHFIGESVNPIVYANLGSMGDGEMSQLP